MKAKDKNEKRDDVIFRHHLAGLSHAWIGRKYNLSRSRVQQIIKNQKRRLEMATINLVETRLLEDKIRCPNTNCNGNNYFSYNRFHDDDEWIGLQCECSDCGTLFQINFRAVSIDTLNIEDKPKLINDDSYPLV